MSSDELSGIVECHVFCRYGATVAKASFDLPIFTGKMIQYPSAQVAAIFHHNPFSLHVFFESSRELKPGICKQLEL
jgi:hypothetical protein